MKSILSSILLCLLVVDVSSKVSYVTSKGGVGAVYAITNGAKMNRVVIYRINKTGQLTFVGTVNTNGRGLNAPIFDPLNSQGSMAVYSNCLFVVNPGSNSLSMFIINPKDATQLKFKAVEATNGIFPVSITVNSKYVCALTGGPRTGIRCYRYGSWGLSIVQSFDRNLTQFVSTSIPPTTGPGTASEILFSADGLSLIIAIKGFSPTARGFLLFYLLNNDRTKLSLNPIKQTLPNMILPFSMELVGSDGLLVTDPGPPGVFILKYSSKQGKITNSFLRPVNASLAALICWSVFSPKVGNYYATSEFPASIIELNLNLNSHSNPLTVVKYYPLPSNIGALDPTLVSLDDFDYLYVNGATTPLTFSYRLNGPGRASPNGIVQPNLTDTVAFAGIASYVQRSNHQYQIYY